MSWGFWPSCIQGLQQPNHDSVPLYVWASLSSWLSPCGVAKTTTTSSQLLSHQPSQPQGTEPLPTRSPRNSSTGPHWPILGHMSIPQPIMASKRMDGSAWPHPGPTPTPVLRVGVSPAQSTQWLIVREAWSRGKSEVDMDTEIVDVSEAP